MSTTKEQTITLPLNDFIWCLLGDNVTGSPCTTITEQTAIILQHHLKDSLVWKVEFCDKEGNKLDKPYLWRYTDWKSSSDTYHRQKLYAHNERIKRWLKDKNIDNLAKCIMKSTKMSIEQARPIAATVFEKGNMEVLNFLGLNRLVTKESEL